MYCNLHVTTFSFTYEEKNKSKQNHSISCDSLQTTRCYHLSHTSHVLQTTRCYHLSHTSHVLQMTNLRMRTHI